MAADSSVYHDTKNSTGAFNTKNGQSPSVTDYLCPVCLQLLIEPVVMPCKHELCRPCFRQNVEEANLVCPLCRKRISSWARKNAREGTLINSKRWELIKKLFPERCKKRLMGLDDDDSEDLPAPKRLLSSTGELRKEYEDEIKKIHEAEEAENKASEELIKQIEEVERKQIEELERQKMKDEEVALNLSQEYRHPKTVTTASQNTPRNQVNKKPTAKKKKGNTKPTIPVKTLHQWFSPVRNTPRSSMSSDSSSDLSCCELQDYDSKEESSADETSHCSQLLITNNKQLDPKSSLFTQYEQDYFKHLEEKRRQEEHDMRLAKELQKQFDFEQKHAVVNRQKGSDDAYSLRRGSATETSTK